MSERVDFEFTKDFGSTKKGTVKRFRKSFVSALMKEKCGKVVTAKAKAARPKANKVEPKAQQRATK